MEHLVERDIQVLIHQTPRDGQRQAIEPVFTNTDPNRGIGRFRRRGRAAVRAALVALLGVKPGHGLTGGTQRVKRTIAQTRGPRRGSTRADGSGAAGSRRRLRPTPRRQRHVHRPRPPGPVGCSLPRVAASMRCVPRKGPQAAIPAAVSTSLMALALGDAKRSGHSHPAGPARQGVVSG